MFVLVVIVAYLIGSLPMGYIYIRLLKGQDVTKIGSGRTGGTNAMRAGGVWMGVLTAASDVLKGVVAVWLARMLVPGVVWVEVLAGLAAVFGHNWSIWVYRLTGRLSGGAGTGPNIGAALMFWPGVILIGIPLVLFFVFVIGYASLASLATALAIFIIFLLRSLFVGSPWEYVIYSLLAGIAVAWALRPNIERLINGTERRVGLLAKKKE